MPDGAGSSDWEHTRTREPADTNPDVRSEVDARGYCLFKIGLSLEELPPT